jgi:hypothetical protein
MLKLDVRGLQGHRIAAEDIGSRKTILIPRIQLRSPDPTIPFKLCRRRFPIKIAFAMTVSKAQGQTLKRVAIYPPSPVFPMASCLWHFPDPLHLTKSLLQLLKGIDSV